METGDVSSTFWSLAAGLSQPLWDGRRLAQEVERSRAGYRAQEAALRASVLTAFREVEDALAANHHVEVRIALLEDQVEAAAATLEVARESYLQGLSDYLTVLTAQSAYFNAESQLLASRRQLISERVSLARALGGRWPMEELQRRFDDDGEKDE